MAASEIPAFPLVEMQAVVNAGNQWVALCLRVAADGSDQSAAWQAVFEAPELLAAVAPLDCVLLIPAPAVLNQTLLDLMPPNRVMFAIDAAAVADPAACRCMAALQEDGYRILLDGAAPLDAHLPPALGAQSRDCSADGPDPGALLALFGPHLARGVHSAERLEQCARAGFGWFSGDYPLHPAPSGEPDDGSSRKRLLSLLGLLAADAETRELQALLRQDPALSYHLLKLVNSAAFALSTPITSFAQAIGVLGRRQLQRWLQLLLYARLCDDGLPNPLLPVAALRAAQMESLCKQQGGDRDAQDLAFLTGVFSLLDVLLAIPMGEIVGALRLAPDAAGALLERGGRLGRMLAVVENRAPSAQDLREAGIDVACWWKSQLHAYHWAIQVSRNL